MNINFEEKKRIICSKTRSFVFHFEPKSEFLTPHQVLTSSGNEAQIRDAFRVFDKDDKGYLTVRKMRNM